MGNYVPAGPRSKKTITDTLQESEYEHYLDCPNADFVIRIAACFLDFILCSIAWSAMNHISGALEVSLSTLRASGHLNSNQLSQIVPYCFWVLKILLLYLNFVWAVASFGGSPGKLLLGLRILDNGNGYRLSFPRAFFREIPSKTLSLITIVGPLMPLLRTDRRALHDLMAQSVVKRIRGEP